jgi:hypothetical protein
MVAARRVFFGGVTILVARWRAPAHYLITMTDTDTLTETFREAFPPKYTSLGVELAAEREAANERLASDGEIHTTNNCGGTCDRCGTPIFDVYAFRAGNGKTFKLGVDCVAIVFPRSSSARKIVKETKVCKARIKLRAQWERIASALAAGELDSLPHPYGGASLAHYAARSPRTAAAAARILRHL